MASIDKKCVHAGPGGIHCPCCFPAPGTVARKKRFKKARKKAKDLEMKEKLEEVNVEKD